MATDWLRTLKERSELALKTTRAMPGYLADPSHSLDEIEHLHDVVTKCSKEMTRLKGQLRRAKVDASLRKSADSLKVVWDDIGHVVSDRLEEMRRH
ncbi:hypothetical protein SAMN04488498_12351 [Mesorhizobium albiziae]|uniref:Uncharacterized protein n=1 Tax=Neomesorhizobium albiziae TaxID=335020 RepID=A0A1I4E6R6_9HYPH|nr:hypothetical protein [Mesorhizobium albiziae]GLS33825.1 hypothetical protein GCM10007937_55380 [Mesorhizobium albiziae]SFL01462.1 hypothetical protein SAMN04488498_12351 [Mesorhizobium albiziae]